MTEDWPVPDRTPPGWYEDPRDRGLLRWWNGKRWAAATKPVSQAAPAAARTPGRPPFRHADDPATRLDGPVTQTDRRYQGSPAGRRAGQGAAPGAARGPVAPRTSAGGRPPGKPDTGAQAMRRSARDRVTLSALFAFSLLLLVVGYALGSDGLRLFAVTGALFFGVGTAPLQLSERAPMSLRLGVAVIVGLSIPVVVGSVMVLVPLWHPVVAAVLFGIAAIAMHAVGCRRVLSGPLGTGILRSTSPRPPLTLSSLDPALACGILGTVLWVAGMLAAGHMVPGLFGFLVKVPVYWYLGLALLLAAIVLARGKRELPSVIGVVSLLGAVTLTPSVIYGWPRQPAGVKHVELVQAILQAHYLNRGAGIYQAYSGFFSAVAWVCDVSGMHNVMAIATYWPFFIDLLGIVVLRSFLGQLTASVYRVWLAVTMVVLTNTVGQDYFSPQSAAFVVGIGVFWLVLDRGGFPGLNERGRIGLIALAACMMAVTHELTPYIVGGALAVLVVFRVIRPWWLPVLVLAPAGLWALLNKDDLGGFITISLSGGLANFEPPKQATAGGLARLPAVGESSDALLLGLLVLIIIACIGLLRNFRSKTAWAFMVSTGVALAAIAGNSYGNEGIFRAALFALPWLAAVGSQVLPRTRGRWSSGIFGVVAAVLLATYLVSEFALDNADVVRPSDYATMLKYEDTTSANSYIFDLTAAGDLFPLPVTHPAASGHTGDWNVLATLAQQAITHPTVQDANSIAEEYYEYALTNDGETSELYAVWSPVSANYCVDYGAESMAEAVAWRTEILASPDWQLVYSNDGSYLFRVKPTVRGPQAAPAAPAPKTAPKPAAGKTS